jgi:hypothetical protein
VALNIDAIKELAHKAFEKEYAEKTPTGHWADIGAAGAILFAGGALTFFAILGFSALGAPVAAGVGMAALIATAGGGMGILTSMMMMDEKIEAALQRDLNNGVLVKRFQDEILAPSATPPSPVTPAFTAVHGGAPAGNDNPALKIPAVKPPIAGL